MSKETLAWLNENVLVGYGHEAWHFSADAQGEEPNHYPHAIPADDVRRRLFAWDAVPAPLTVVTDHGVSTVPGKVANVRSDTGDVLGVVSTSYAIHQFADSLLGGAEKITGAGLGIASAGLLRGGAVGWVSVSLADTTVTAQGVEFLPYLLCYGSHDGSLSTGYKRVVTNVVCDNTMAIALGENTGRQYRIRHTRNSAIRVADAQDALAILVGAADDFSAQVSALCEITVTDRQWFAFLNEYAPLPEESGRGRTMAENKREALNDMYFNDYRCRDWRGTGWGVVQTANTYAHHVQTVRGATRGERNMLSTLDGSWDAFDVNTVATLNRVTSA